jgi:hypothetical protein
VFEIKNRKTGPHVGDVEYYFVKERLQLLNRIWGIESLDVVYCLFDKYYSEADKEYVSSDPAYLKILEAFRSLEEE